MGGNLCTLRQSCCSNLADDDHLIEGPTVKEFSKPRKLVESGKKVKDVKPTVEQWMFRDPDPFDACKLKKQSAKVSAVTNSYSYERVYSTPRESFSADMSSRVSSSSPRKSLNGQRRVSFKLPEEADIHIIYACEDTEKECEL